MDCAYAGGHFFQMEIPVLELNYYYNTIKFDIADPRWSCNMVFCYKSVQCLDRLYDSLSSSWSRRIQQTHFF